MKKRLIGLFFFFFFFLVFCSTLNFLTLSEEELDQKVPQVLDSLWKEHGLLHYQIVKTDPTISIGINTSKDIAGLQSILEKKLPKQALENYEIEIFQRNKNDINVD